MKKLVIATVFVAVIVSISIFAINTDHVSIPYVNAVDVTDPPTDPKKTLSAFSSPRDLDKFLKKHANKRERRDFDSKVSAASPSSNIASKSAAESEGGESITNVQHAGVDEGGIVKLHRGHLVVLRRGRLFTIKLKSNDLTPVSMVDAFPPKANPSGTWYDEMLISGNTVAVIGYSYARGGTEIGLFDINNNGVLKYRSTYHMTSNDYYSSRNYASRLVNGKLIFYTPQYLWIDPKNPTAGFPAVRKWHAGATEDEFKKIVGSRRVYRATTEPREGSNLTLHTVTTCDLNSDNFECEGTSILGPAGRIFYVSPQSVYVWTTAWNQIDGKPRASSVVYKMPLDGRAPSALQVSGSPVDQFSFLESKDAHLNVLVRSNGNGETMWSSEISSGSTALLRVPLTSFGDGTEAATTANYTKLLSPTGYTMQNRFVGNYLLYGGGNSWGRSQNRKESALFAVQWKTGEFQKLPIAHSVDRIEGLGKDAVVVGTKGKNLHFSPVSLKDSARVEKSFVRENASQGELRSHGFFYKPLDNTSGMLGLPIAEQGRPGYKHLVQGSASILFLKNKSLQFGEIGALNSSATSVANDNCKASCVDWYGNARPLFIQNRVFALLGYELVEGSVNRDGIRETRRVNFAPIGNTYERNVE